MKRGEISKFWKWKIRGGDGWVGSRKGVLGCREGVQSWDTDGRRKVEYKNHPSVTIEYTGFWKKHLFSYD